QGLPPPPQPLPAAGAVPINAGKDPNMQQAAPNDMLKLKKRKHGDAALPDLKNFVFNTKKTALDPKRNRSELSRFARAPFGEGADTDSLLEEAFRTRYSYVRRLAEELEKFHLDNDNEEENS